MSEPNTYNIPLGQPTNYQISQVAQNNIPIPVPLMDYKGNVISNTTTFIPRVNNQPVSPNPLNTAGIPGANFVNSDPAPAQFYQGEDVIYDAFLFINNQAIDLKRYEIQAIVKPTPYILCPTWLGYMGNGIYVDSKIPNHFVIFIPNVVTSTLIAGTFELDVWATEQPNQLNDVRPRVLLVGKTFFNLDYAAFSPDPESLQPGANPRWLLKNSYPTFVPTTAPAESLFASEPVLGA